jgi:hypothetical protein
MQSVLYVIDKDDCFVAAMAKLMHENVHLYALLVRHDTKLNFTFCMQD